MAFRREDKPFYMGIPLEVMNRIGQTLREGAIKFEENPWERFYQTKSSPEDFLEFYEHVIAHVYKAYDEMVNGKVHDGSEDHLGHALVNLIMIAWAQENGKLPNKMQSLIQGNPALAPTYEDNDPEELEAVYSGPTPETLIDRLRSAFAKKGQTA